MWRIPVALVVRGAATFGISGRPANADAGSRSPRRDGARRASGAAAAVGHDQRGRAGRPGDRAAGVVADAAGVPARRGLDAHGGTVGTSRPGRLRRHGPRRAAVGHRYGPAGDIAVGVSSDLFEGWLVTAHRATHQLHDFAGGTNAYVRAINDDGLMVGEALDANGNDFAAKWPHWWSRPIRLDPAAGYDGSYAQGVNDKGVVTGR